MACKSCGEAGHYTKTCPNAKGATPAKKPGAKKATTPAAGGTMQTVRETLVGRREELQHELTTVDRILGDIDSLGGGK